MSGAETTPGRTPMMSWRGRPRSNPIPRAEAARQGAITQLAFLLLGREAAIAFLNTMHEGLGGRPLELATSSAAGRANVEAELARMAYHTPDGAAPEEASAALPLPGSA